MKYVGEIGTHQTLLREVCLHQAQAESILTQLFGKHRFLNELDQIWKLKLLEAIELADTLVILFCEGPHQGENLAEILVPEFLHALLAELLDYLENKLHSFPGTLQNSGMGDLVITWSVIFSLFPDFFETHDHYFAFLSHSHQANTELVNCASFHCKSSRTHFFQLLALDTHSPGFISIFIMVRAIIASLDILK